MTTPDLPDGATEARDQSLEQYGGARIRIWDEFEEVPAEVYEQFVIRGGPLTVATYHDG